MLVLKECDSKVFSSGFSQNELIDLVTDIYEYGFQNKLFPKEDGNGSAKWFGVGEEI
jgi:hypothetical protein